MSTLFASNPLRRPLHRALLVGLLVVAAASFTGCAGENDSADLDRGRQLFASNCAGCHVLAQAGSTGQLGPNLDSSFEAAREAGMDDATIHGVVHRQIGFPRTAPAADPYVYMPADIVTGQDAIDVSGYVASVAGIPGIEPPKVPGPPGAQIFFDNGCAGCHTLAVAGAGGTTGPNLDEVLSGVSAAFVMESIVDPDADVAAGFPAGVMPAYTSLTEDELRELISYLLECSGPNPAASCTETPAD